MSIVQRSLKVANNFQKQVVKTKVAMAVKRIKANLNLKTDSIQLDEKKQSLLDKSGALPMTGALGVPAAQNSLSAWIAYNLGKGAMIDEILTQEKNPDLMHEGVSSEIVLAKSPSDVERLVGQNRKDLAETKPLKTVYINDDEYKLYFTSFME